MKIDERAPDPTVVRSLADELSKHALARPDLYDTWCVCLRWSVRRGTRDRDTVAYEQHLAASLATALSATAPDAGPVLCSGCGHQHTPQGCAGEPTPSDRWAGVSVSSCDCDDQPAPDAGQREAQERAEVDDWLQRAADDLRTAAAPVWGGDSPWMTTGAKVADLAARWVEEFATDTRADRSPEQP